MGSHGGLEMLTKDQLQAIINVIDIAASRGTWKGDEMLPVGSLRAAIEEAMKESIINDEVPIDDEGRVPVGGKVAAKKD